jgi:hypothetical protein
MTAHASATARIDAPAREVYDVFADYRDGHPHVLPRQFFSSLEVLSGGRGAGTRIRVGTRLLGVEKTFDMTVTEPEPGRVLLETDPVTGLETAFLVEPIGDSERSQVTIATTWQPRSGLAGRIERVVTPPLLRWVYRKELAQLSAFLRSRRRVRHR